MKKLSIAFLFLGLLVILDFFLSVIFWYSMTVRLIGLLVACGLIISIFFISAKIAKVGVLFTAFLLILGYFDHAFSFFYFFLGIGLICSSFFLNTSHNQIPNTNEGKPPLQDNNAYSNGEHYQRVVTEDEVETLLSQGWKVVACLPSGKVVVSNEHYMQTKTTQVSDGWYLVPFFFSILGGIIGYVAVKDRDAKKAQNILLFGLGMFLFEIFIILIL
jgi:hypothetical protein